MTRKRLIYYFEDTVQKNGVVLIRNSCSFLDKDEEGSFKRIFVEVNLFGKCLGLGFIHSLVSERRY